MKKLLKKKVIGKRSDWAGHEYLGFSVTEQNVNQHLKILSKYVLASILNAWLNKAAQDIYKWNIEGNKGNFNSKEFFRNLEYKLSMTKKTKYEAGCYARSARAKARREMAASYKS